MTSRVVVRLVRVQLVVAYSGFPTTLAVRILKRISAGVSVRRSSVWTIVLVVVVVEILLALQWRKHVAVSVLLAHEEKESHD